MAMQPTISLKHQVGSTVFSYPAHLAPSRALTRRAGVLLVLSMFGSTKLNNESIKDFAKNEFYLANTLAGLEEKSYTWIMCLEKLICKYDIAL